MANVYDAVIIGAGNAGLTAAIRLRMEGKKTLLIERHHTPGGCGTSFRRGRFEFEVSIHELCGVGDRKNQGSSGERVARLNMDFERVLLKDCFRTIGNFRDGGLMDATMPSGRESFIDAMENYVPGSRDSMERLFDLLEEFRYCMDLLLASDGNLPVKELLTKCADVFECGTYSTLKVMEKLKVPDRAADILASYWSYLGVPLDELPFLHYALMIRDYIYIQPTIPKHTAHEISEKAIDTYRKLGGEVWFGVEAEEILFTDGTVSGVRTSAGTVSCRAVLPNMNPDTVFTKLVPEKEVPATVRKTMAARGGSYSGYLAVVYFGLNKTAKEIGIKDYTCFLSRTADTRETYERAKCFDTDDYTIFTCPSVVNPDASPEGTSVCTFTYLFSKDVWDVSPEEYFRMKTELEARSIRLFRERYGVDLRPYIEEAEVSTPLTNARYVGTPEGAVYGYHIGGWDNMLARKMTEEKEYPVKGIFPIGGAMAGGLGYCMVWASGEDTALRVTEYLGGEEKKA